MDRVVAQGTFDLLHPGHVHYLSEAATMGEKLHVIVARDENVTHKPSPIIAGKQRVEMVEALGPVDHARLGHPEDIFVPIKEISPSVIALGHDQHHDVAGIEQALAEQGIDCDVVRASGREAEAEEILSTGTIIDRIVDRRC
jgi:FAD synthetase